MRHNTTTLNGENTASNPSSVHTPSSSMQITGVPTFREYLDANATRGRLAASAFYSTLSRYDGGKLYERFCKCRSNATFAREVSSGKIKILTSSCHLRFCPYCNRSRGLMIFRNVSDWLKKTKYPKFVTFTLKHSTDPLPEQMNRLYKCFKDVRRGGVFKKTCHSGIWFFQIKKSDKTNEWHPHIHCIVDGKYIPWNKLKMQWKKITKDSNIVDVRLVKDAKKAADYVSRYAVKPTDITHLDFEEQLEIHNAVMNRRLCGTWGKCREMKLTTPPKFKSEQFEKIGGWQEILLQVNTNPTARAIYTAWLSDTPLTGQINLYPEKKYPPPDGQEFNTAEKKSDLFLF